MKPMAIGAAVGGLLALVLSLTMSARFVAVATVQLPLTTGLSAGQAARVTSLQRPPSAAELHVLGAQLSYTTAPGLQPYYFPSSPPTFATGTFTATSPTRSAALALAGRAARAFARRRDAGAGPRSRLPDPVTLGPSAAPALVQRSPRRVRDTVLGALAGALVLAAVTAVRRTLPAAAA